MQCQALHGVHKIPRDLGQRPPGSGPAAAHTQLLSIAALLPQPPAGSRDRPANRLDRLTRHQGWPPGSTGSSKYPDGRLSGGAKGGKGGRAEEFAQGSSWPDRADRHPAPPTNRPPRYLGTALPRHAAGTCPVANGPSWLIPGAIGNNIVRRPSNVEGP